MHTTVCMYYCIQKSFLCLEFCTQSVTLESTNVRNVRSCIIVLGSYLPVRNIRWDDLHATSDALQWYTSPGR